MDRNTPRLQAASPSHRRVQQIHIEDMLHQAAKLFGDGQGNELGQNDEYERGIAEFICRQAGLPSSQTPDIIQRIHASAGKLRPASCAM